MLIYIFILSAYVALSAATVDFLASKYRKAHVARHTATQRLMTELRRHE